ncbi:AroM family protein [Bradyrhizobium sp. USDA 4353]
MLSAPPPDHVTPRRMGVVVIGQSPRPTMQAEIAAVLSHGIMIELRGALDGMSRAEIDAIPPVDGADALFTLLPNGDDVRLSKKAVEARANAQLARFRQEGIDVAMLACTGKFPNLAPEGLVVLPSAVLHKMVEAVLPKGRLGVFSPLQEQTALIAGKWQREGVEVVGVTLQPGSDDAAVDAAAREMAAQQPDLVVLDCMSYSSANKARVRRHYPGPVILSIAAAARVVEELVS